MRHKPSVTLVLICLLGLLAQALAPTASADTPPAQCRAHTSDYIIGPGDELRVYVWQNPDLTITVPVRPDGKISTPLDEDMVAVGKTPYQVARDSEKVLGENERTHTEKVSGKK